MSLSFHKVGDYYYEPTRKWAARRVGDEMIIIAIKSKNGQFRKLSAEEEIHSMYLKFTYEPATQLELAKLNSMQT